MNQALIDSYQPGGNIYAQLLSQYGQAGADTIAAAAATGNSDNVTAAIANVRSGPARNDSTLSIFTNQILTDPLAAPLADANTLLGNTFLSFLKNPWVLGAVALGLFFAFGGADYITRKIAGK